MFYRLVNINWHPCFQNKHGLGAALIFSENARDSAVTSEPEQTATATSDADGNKSARSPIVLTLHRGDASSVDLYAAVFFRCQIQSECDEELEASCCPAYSDTEIPARTYEPLYVCVYVCTHVCTHLP
jgi:hypothetical protein